MNKKKKSLVKTITPTKEKQNKTEQMHFSIRFQLGNRISHVWKAQQSQAHAFIALALLMLR